MEDTLRVFTFNANVESDEDVLILVLMEDTLREKSFILLSTAPLVLILVLMEDTLRDEKETRKSFGIFNVLILVLMEDTLRDIKHK